VCHPSLSWKVAQADFKRPESVLVVIYTRTGQVLLLERTQPKGFWQSVTGSLRRDESAADAAQREVEEETGIVAAILQDSLVDTLIDTGIKHRFPILPEWRSRYAPDVESNLEHLFYLPLESPCTVRLNPDEHTNHQWLPWSEAASRVFSWTNRDAILALESMLPRAIC